MITAYRSLTTLSITLFSFCTALAQTHSPASQPPTPVVTASASSDRVRYASLGEVHQTRLQVFSSDGAQVFDSNFRLGNLLTWRLVDQQGSRLADGSYLFLVTVKDFNGNLTQKYGASVLERGQVYLEQAGRDELSAPQATALEANRLTEVVTPVDRLGAAVSGGAESAEATPTAESTPGTTSTQESKTGKSSTQATTTDVSGTGTTGQLVKWTDGATGALGDSIVTESANKIGIATSTPRARLDIKQSVDSFIGGLHLRRSTTNDTWALVTGTDNNLYMGYATNASGADAASDFGAYPLVLAATNRVGIGTGTPQARLDIKQSVDSMIGGLHLRRNTTNDTWALVTGGDNNLYIGYATSASGADAAGDFTTLPLVLTPTNRVGIGTIAPTAKLQVNGDVNFTGLRTEVTASTPNVIGGFSGNSVTAGAFGATIGGGGESPDGAGPNRVTDEFGTVGGGAGNRAGNDAPSFVGFTTVGGGLFNIASGGISTVGGGATNTASGHASTVPGGTLNTASGDDSFAAGRRASALHQGSFVWSDSTTAHPNFFSSTADNQFLINATGGVGIGTNSPGGARLKVQGGDVYITSPNSLVITSPNGSCWQIRVTDAGALTAASVACP